MSPSLVLPVIEKTAVITRALVETGRATSRSRPNAYPPYFLLMDQAVVGRFDTAAQAQQAAQKLNIAGFGTE